MLRPFEEGEIGITYFLPLSKTLITAERGRQIKFWELPRAWRDSAVQAEEEREIEIRRKV